MAGSSGSLAVSKSRARTGKRSSNYDGSSRHSSLLDTDVGMEAWPMSESGSGSNDVKKEAEKKDETERDATMGQLLDFAEEIPDAAGRTGKGKELEKKSRMQQLYELQGLDVDAVTTTTTTITTTTFVKAQPVSAHTSPEQSKQTIQSDSPSTPQYTTSDSLSIKDLSISEPRYDTEQPIAAATNNLPTTPPSVSAFNDHDPIPNTTTNTHKTPSSPSTIPPPPPSSPPPEPALQTFRSQQLHHETNPPRLGTEISTWAASINAAPPPFPTDEEAPRDESGYVRRFTTRRGKTSDAEPKEENAIVKWDPFGGLWGYAVNKKVWVVEKGERGKKDIERKEKEEKQEDISNEAEGGYKETPKKEEEKETYFDALESFLNPT